MLLPVASESIASAGILSVLSETTVILATRHSLGPGKRPKSPKFIFVRELYQFPDQSVAGLMRTTLQLIDGVIKRKQEASSEQYQENSPNYLPCHFEPGAFP